MAFMIQKIIIILFYSDCCFMIRVQCQILQKFCPRNNERTCSKPQSEVFCFRIKFLVLNFFIRRLKI